VSAMARIPSRAFCSAAVPCGHRLPGRLSWLPGRPPGQRAGRPGRADAHFRMVTRSAWKWPGRLGTVPRVHVPEKVGPEEGMLFPLPRRLPPFWMKNCRVPLDLIWLSEPWRSSTSRQECPPAPRPCPATFDAEGPFVLEVKGDGGESRPARGGPGAASGGWKRLPGPSIGCGEMYRTSTGCAFSQENPGLGVQGLLSNNPILSEH